VNLVLEVAGMILLQVRKPRSKSSRLVQLPIMQKYDANGSIVLSKFRRSWPEVNIPYRVNEYPTKVSLTAMSKSEIILIQSPRFDVSLW
jgi:hypothetical protein